MRPQVLAGQSLAASRFSPGVLALYGVVENKLVRVPEIHRHHRDEAIRFRRSQGHSKGLPYVSVRMIAGPQNRRQGGREAPEERIVVTYRL
jgi:hypothetical protein